ncbi:hypothetical protein E2C01_064359 [Portunus trituberculatus]|uniref:Uncharacterized protein n=1 Tax=Portunus trituberculatus TaxID=210409 RepID=A0A5B7HCT5_PORTR|nr:hypothetical protein [Portunus trituberculatus]
MREISTFLKLFWCGVEKTSGVEERSKRKREKTEENEHEYVLATVVADGESWVFHDEHIAV